MARFEFALQSVGYNSFSMGYLHIAIEYQGNGVLYKRRNPLAVAGSAAVTTSSPIEIPDNPVLQDLTGYILRLNLGQGLAGLAYVNTTFEIIHPGAQTTAAIYSVGRYMGFWGAATDGIDITGSFTGYRIDRSHPVLGRVLSIAGIPGISPDQDARDYFSMVGRWPAHSGIVQAAGTSLPGIGQAAGTSLPDAGHRRE